MVQLASVTVPPRSKPTPAELPLTVQPVSVITPGEPYHQLVLNRPPPLLAEELPLTVQFVSETTPLQLATPPPPYSKRPPLAVLPLTVQSVNVAVPP